MQIVLDRWDGAPHQQHECVYLGADDWGDWLGPRTGRRSVILVPPSGEWLLTTNAAPHPERVRIAMAWDVGWHGPTPRGVAMELAVVGDASGGARIVGREGWDASSLAFGYPSGLTWQLEETAESLVHAVGAQEPPFDDATADRWFAALARLA